MMPGPVSVAEPQPHRLVLLGGARLEGPQPIARFEKKTAGLLAYLAVEGATPRSRIAGLLWPESKEATARNNLAQAIRRLRNASGAAFVVGDESLVLEGARTDVSELLLAVHAGSFAAAAQQGHELCAGYDFDDCPEFESWLKGAREQIKRAWAKAVTAEIERAEADGRVDDALALAERGIAAEPLSEAAHLRVARLWLGKGDAPQAMSAYERCRKMLARELAMKPSAAMLEVLRAIREGKAPAIVRRQAAPVALPAAVLRPPWVGRREEWAELERAFAARSGIIVVGAPGVGKSRLVREFAERQGPFVVIEARPGDPDVPYGTLARGLRALLRDRKPALPAWALHELGQLVPELVPEEPSPLSRRSKLRFLDAFAQLMRAAVIEGVKVLVVDDLQWSDPASAEALLWIAEQCWSGDLGAFAVIAHRDEDLAEATAERIARALSAGLASRIDLAPLTPAETLELCRSLGVEALAERVEAIAHASHGVPLFLLEIVRAALDAGADDARVPIPDRVKALVKRRLERLGEPALRLARVAAVAGPVFDLELAMQVLGASALDLAEPWSALEAAQVLASGRVSHDVLAEVLREDLPRVVREHLHASIAERLAAKGADAALVAHHYEAGGRAGAAAPYLLRAGVAARMLSRISEAAQLFERAARAFEGAGDPSGACEALYQLVRGPVGPDAERHAATLERLASSTRDRARARGFRAGLLVDAGHYEEAELTAREAVELARDAGDPIVLAESVQVRLDAAIRMGRLGSFVHELLDAFEAACEGLADPEGLAAAALYRGEVALLESDPARALPHVNEALEHLERWGQLLYGKARVLAARARVHVALADLAAARRDIDEAEIALRDATGVVGARAHLRIARAEVYLAEEDGDRALEALGELPGGGALPRDVRAARVLQAEALVQLGRHDEASAVIADIVGDPIVDAHLRARAARARDRIVAAGAGRSREKAARSSSGHRG